MQVMTRKQRNELLERMTDEVAELVLRDNYLQTQSITVSSTIGALLAGHVSGDVFGNGILLSKHIKLIGAFNHLHIFIDPNPNPAKSWAERKRLFELPRSAWTDYAKKLISKGGGIFDRKAKSIDLSPQMKKLFELTAATTR